MTDTTVTRIRLPTDIHLQVKAAAVLHSINVDEALGMCVAYLVGHVEPLSWLDGGKPKPVHTGQKGE
jgi:hypothetical protein